MPTRPKHLRWFKKDSKGMKVPDTDYVAPTTVNAMDVAEAGGVEAYKQKTLREQQALENTRKVMNS